MPISKIFSAAPLMAASLSFSAAAEPDYVKHSWDHAYRQATSTPTHFTGIAFIGLAATVAFLYWLFRRYG
jgi:hypothetical protein